MSVMHQIPGAALNLVSPQKLEGDTVNIFNTRGHVQANIEDFPYPSYLLFLCFTFPLSFPSLLFKRLCC